MSTLNQEMYRRMTNTSELVTMSKRVEIVDLYGQKLTNSGYRLDQLRRAMVGGLVRYERRLLHSRQNPEEAGDHYTKGQSTMPGIEE